VFSLRKKLALVLATAAFVAALAPAALADTGRAPGSNNGCPGHQPPPPPGGGCGH
jgi:Spy/CpxP family protein refolding chaperone